MLLLCPPPHTHSIPTLRSHFASLSVLTALRSLTLTRIAPKVLTTLAAMTQLTLLDICCISMNPRWGIGSMYAYSCISVNTGGVIVRTRGGGTSA